MPRFARVVAPGAPHHVTQRSVSHQFVLQSDADRTIYLELLRHACRLYKVSLAGYCLMSNHVHLIAIPDDRRSLPLALKYAHGRYATYFNASRTASGHVWQGRYYSCPMDTPHLWAALRYTELNPVRAGLAREAEGYRWSSAAAHCGGAATDWLDLRHWGRVWNASDWKTYLAADAGTNEDDEIRRSTHTGWPLGAGEFVDQLEKALQRRLKPLRGGRPRKSQISGPQEAMAAGLL